MTRGFILSLLVVGATQLPAPAQATKPVQGRPKVRVWYWPPVRETPVDAELAAKRTPSLVPSMEPIRFAAGSSKLAVGADALQPVCDWLKANPGSRVILHGHSDPRGSLEPNQRLSERRAAAVKEALIRSGAPESQVLVVGHGASEPVTGKSPDETGFLSRRVAFQFADDPPGSLATDAGSPARKE